MKASDAFALAIGILKKSESLTIPSNANAANAFQNLDGDEEGKSQGSMATRLTLAAKTAPTSR